MHRPSYSPGMARKARVADVHRIAAAMPHVTKVEGSIADGEKITVHSEVAAGRAFPVKGAMRQPAEVTWTGGMPLGLITGVRTFRLLPDGGGTKVTMREEYSGPLVGLMGRSIPDLQPSFDRFVNGLKARAEAG